MKILVFDTETTGLPDWSQPSESPQQPHIVEIAALMFDGDTGEKIGQMHAVVRPAGWIIPEEVAAIHGITTERATAEGQPEGAVLQEFLALHALAGLRVAHNESFDQRIIRIAIKRYADEDECNADVIADAFKAAPAYCTCNAAKPIMKLPPTPKMLANPRFRNSYKQPSLQEAHKHFLGVDFDGAHGALADAEACARVYFALNPVKVPA